MRDMRDYESSNSIANDMEANAPIFTAPVLTNDTPLITDESIVTGEKSGLGEFHHNDDAVEEGSGRNKAIGALIVALMLGAAGAYAYGTYTSAPREAVASSSLPRTAALSPSAVTPAAPPMATPATAPEMTPQAPMPQSPAMSRQAKAAPAKAPISGRDQGIAATPLSAPVVTPENQAFNQPVPEPVSPTPPASAQAANSPANQQPSPDSDVPVTPPAPLVIAPAPVQPDGQDAPAAPQPAVPAQ